MNHYNGRLKELLLEPYKNASALLELPRKAMPRPGQYLLANETLTLQEPVPIALFPAGPGSSLKSSSQGLLPMWGQLPEHWNAGTPLALRGPLGRGFTIPLRARRVAFIALAETPARLLPALIEAANKGLEITLYCDSPTRELPLNVEVHPLVMLTKPQEWADFILVDTVRGEIDGLAQKLGAVDQFASLNGEILVLGPMPCGGLAQCGVCSLNIALGQKFICEDGPVFNLAELVS
ncbi:MAG: hypothetical protein O3B43_00605 [Chloroflexi bacterium]|nr:hypothetical protein [Chloroflexota bacterium]